MHQTLTVGLPYVNNSFDVAKAHHLQVFVRLDGPDGVKIGSGGALDAVVLALSFTDLHKGEKESPIKILEMKQWRC